MTVRARIAALRLPVMVAPMFLVSGPDIVLAAMKAGITGAFPTPNCRTTADLDAWLARIAGSASGALWAANLVTHSTNTRLADDLALIARYRPPIVITALGSPRPAIEVVHGYGGVVLADVTGLDLARKAAAAGADGLVCVCAGAGGHTGTLSPFAFLSAVRAEFDGIVCLAGGLSDGYGVAAAVAAGADLVYMGTRFLAARESMAVPDYKQMVIAATLRDILVSDAVTGTAASWLIPSLVRNGYDPADMRQPPARDYGGDPTRWKDVWAAGLGVNAVTREETVAEIVESLEVQFRAAAQRLRQSCPG